MFEKFFFRSLAAAAFAAALLAATAHADSIMHGGTTINMDFVSVGNPGNAGDDQPQGTFGAVSYAYRIGKYEVTENQWDAVVAADANDLLSDPGYWIGDQPVAHVSWHEAAMFCNWLSSGNVRQGAYAINGSGQVTGIDRDGAVSTYGTVYVIPTENEWYKAAYYDPDKPSGAGYYDYPTGSDDVPDGIDLAADGTFDAVFLDGYNQGRPNDVDDAGVLLAYGTMGQGGNVREWNETEIGLSRGVRGGFWGRDSGDLRAFVRLNVFLPTAEYSSIGFRVASIPEPGSITLLVCGAVAGLIWWRRGK